MFIRNKTEPKEGNVVIYVYH
ncbi:hypothetical protein MAR_021797 [Mya arenaria]|uniref:Uncharacterized protein n=1 Tax=Mya arenaria TaxID=6604 RepID=A0ABY7ECI5_MYAAR|nr:hypothetical protein MAR_021797 [Mya arenaria]